MLLESLDLVCPRFPGTEEALNWVTVDQLPTWKKRGLELFLIMHEEDGGEPTNGGGSAV